MIKTIKVNEETWELLTKQKIKEKVKSIEEIIKENINFSKKFNNEKEFAEWFEDNYNLFGFSRIIKINKASFPDYLMELDGKCIRVELETSSSKFIEHKHNPKNVDMVLCIVNNRKLPVRTIEISPFKLPKNKYILVCIRREDYEKLEKLKIHPNQPYWEVIKNLLEAKQ